MIGIYMQAPKLSVELYHSVDERLMAATGAPPAGLMLHTCFSEGEGLAIFDVWESREAFEAMVPTLMPIAQELGAEIGAPQFVEMIAYQVV
jgi:hypothetical protein